MPVSTTYPGVYVQEVSSGVRTIAGVSTSVAMFIGRAKQGPMKEPTLCLNYSDFERTFSSEYANSDLARAVSLFFQNGGTQCYVMRIANNAQTAKVTLCNENGDSVLLAEAKSAGLVGNDVRLSVNYNTQAPESTFNLDVFLWEDQDGTLVKSGAEEYKALSMDPTSSRYAPDYVTRNSSLVTLSALDPAVVSPSATGYSQGGRILPANTDAELITFMQTTLAASGTTYAFRISVDGGSYVEVDWSETDFTGVADASALQTALAKPINAQLAGSTVTVALIAGPDSKAGDNKLLQIHSANGDVYVQPASENDVASVLMLGLAHGGVEVSRYAVLRPAPTGIVLKSLADAVTFAGLLQNSVTDIELDSASIGLTAGALVTVADDDYMHQDDLSAVNNHCDGVREKWNLIANAVNAQGNADTSFTWTAQVWGSRLALVPGDGEDNSEGVLSSSNAAFDALFRSNVRYYSLGASGEGSYQVPGVAVVDDGQAPKLSDYKEAYDIIDKEVDLFNLLVLPKDADHSDATTATLWGPASTFCQKRRAFLIMDAPEAWATAQNAIDLSSGVNSLRVGLVKDYSALFYPRLKISENGTEAKVGPSGAIAGLMARIDGTRGVWKAPAGTEADLRGVTGLEYKFSDSENGVMNPKGINVLRVFPNGIVNWGARTLDGDDDFGSEYKYIPIRRLSLYIEESLYRGLKWVVFEPNDEPLWAQVRLNVGAFMHNLFRQGAFQGSTPKDAYFVKCDSETTTQNDRNLGRVNIWVGFAPLKPAEFVILYLQQIAGQIQA